ncbi:MAG TPA: flagellar hook protein FlgE [Steroidobacteraceae bacterium]|jgi:flagellar hook protein FlgE
MSFGIALSGLDAAQSNLNVTANNIANSATTGFKSSNSDFAELFAVSPQGVSDTQIGNGVQLQQVEQQFSQGDIQTTGNSLDLALSGNGFFTVSSNGASQYTRAGSFQTNSNGEVVNSAGQNLQVYAPTASGTFNTTSLTNLVIPTGDSAPAASTTAAMAFNLPAASTAPTATPFDPTNANSYNQSTSMTLYDSLGAAHTASMYFVNTGGSTWDAYEYVDGAAVNTAPVKLTYSNSGALTGVTDAAGGTNPAALSFGAYTPTTGAAALNVTFNLSDTTQYGNTFGVTSVTQNGFTTGQLSGVSVSSTGVVQANYTNGQSTALGQVAVANFANEQGLQQVGNTNWVQTFASGQPVNGQAGGSGVGLIESGSLEESNVDITAQLVNMITAQRAFQANAEMVSTENAITQTVINIPNQQ